MKTHLLRPGEGVTMCHLKLWTRPQTFKDLCREYPTEVTCAFCLEVYDNRQEWFWGELTRIKIPAGQKWADVDTPMIYPIEIVKSNPLVWDRRHIVTGWEVFVELRQHPPYFNATSVKKGHQ